MPLIERTEMSAWQLITYTCGLATFIPIGGATRPSVSMKSNALGASRFVTMTHQTCSATQFTNFCPRISRDQSASDGL